MSLIDRDIINCRALVIDSNPTSRSILSGQLRDFGVGTVVQCNRAQDARRHLEVREFDVVLCEQYFDDGKVSGQDLLDDLRKSQLLPYSTVFVMVTGEATYSRVAEAAESALDSYLLKPHTASSLAERLRQARHRKRVLRTIFEAIEQQDFDQAARLCMQRFASRSEYWLFAARIGAELLLRLGKHDAAKRLYEAVTAERAVPWAKLGIARAEIDEGNLPRATRTLESLICEQPSYADAYDVMGRVQVEQGNLMEALETYRSASDLTPNSIARLQKCGMLAFYVGDREMAAKLLERAALIGIKSKTFDFQSLVLLAFTRFQQRDTKGLQRCVDDLAGALERVPESTRLQRFAAIARVLNLMLARQVGQVVAELKTMAKSVREPHFDVEAACNLLALVAQLTAAELNLPDADSWVETLALRFCTSKGVSELLASASLAHAPHSDLVRQCHARITTLAEQSLNHSLNGDPRAAVKSLLVHAGKTNNTKLMDMAKRVLARHAGTIADAASLAEMADTMLQRFGASTGVPPLGRAGVRDSGGLSLRTDATTVAAPAAALPSVSAEPVEA